MSRFFWLKSDKKTVEEISFEKYRDLSELNFASRKRSHQLVVVHDNGDMYCLQGRRGVYVCSRQLKQLLGVFNS